MESSSTNKKFLEELERQNVTLKKLRSTLFEEQLAFIDDPAKKKTAQCTRRAGKSHTAGGYIVHECTRFARSTTLYLATTREQAKRIMVKDILIPIKRQCDIKMKLNRTTLMWEFSNESVCYMLGLDSSPEEMDKAFGQKYRLVIIDEAGSWQQDQRELVHSVLEPACVDLGGTIVMIGSPVNETATYFYDITCTEQDDPKAIPGWSRHKWGWEKNPYTERQMRAHIERIKKESPGIERTPHFRQMYLNEWVVDQSLVIYSYDDEKNGIDEMPDDLDYEYGIGIDLGYNDDTAFTISAWHPGDRNFYFVESYKEPKLTLTDVAQFLTNYRIKYNLTKWVVDGASKQAVAELRARFHFPLEAVFKRDKADIMRIMNSDLLTARIKVVRKGCKPLIREWSNLTWLNLGALKPVENPLNPNHCADSALYNWRTFHTYGYKEQEREIEKGTDEWMEQWWDKKGQQGLAAKNNKISGNFLMRDFGKDYGFK